MEINFDLGCKHINFLPLVFCTEELALSFFVVVEVFNPGVQKVWDFLKWATSQIPKVFLLCPGG
jgi:hypothetical protein